MDGLGTGDLGRGDEVGYLEIALGAAGLADTDRLVGVLDVQRLPVRGGVHGHALDAQFLAGAHDAQGDLAAVADQDLLEHGGTTVLVRVHAGYLRRRDPVIRIGHLR